VSSRVVANPLECIVHCQARSLRDFFGLFGDHAAGKSARGLIADSALLQNADGGNVGAGLGGATS
jgi:hypothetical protein